MCIRDSCTYSIEFSKSMRDVTCIIHTHNTGIVNICNLNIKYCAKLGKSAMETFEMIQHAYGNAVTRQARHSELYSIQYKERISKLLCL